MNVFIKRQLLFEPRTKYFYTTYGYVILGQTIEEVAETSDQQYMRKNIFDIAGMNNTGTVEINKDYTNKCSSLLTHCQLTNLDSY